MSVKRWWREKEMKRAEEKEDGWWMVCGRCDEVRSKAGEEMRGTRRNNGGE